MPYTRVQSHRNIKRGKKQYGEGEDKDKYWKCPHCGFIIDSTKTERNQEWNVHYEPFTESSS